MNQSNPGIARRIIETIGANGIPPQYGVQFFTAGLDPYLSVLEDEYLGSFIKDGGSTFKMIVGVYGGGKTHFLYCLRDLAWRHNFAVSYVSLSAGESPFHKLELVYRAIAKGLTYPLTPEELLSGYETGISSFLKAWYSQKCIDYQATHTPEQWHEEIMSEVRSVSGIESLSFSNAMRQAIESLLEQRDDDFSSICQWLGGENYDSRVHKKFGILQKLDRTTAFTMLRSLTQWVRQVGYSGLLVLLDEAEQVASLSSKQREQHLSNLRELIDECGHTSFQGVGIFYAVPDETFLEGRTQIYEALKQRVSTVFEDFNPTGVKIELEKTVQDPIAFLEEVGQKLVKVYETAYNHEFTPSDVNQKVSAVAGLAHEQRFGDLGYKRLFVQRLISELNGLRRSATRR